MEQGKPELVESVEAAGNAEAAKANTVKPVIKNKKMRAIPIVETAKETAKDEKSKTKNTKEKKRVSPNQQTDDGEQSQEMLNNIITGIQNMSRDPAVFALMNGMNDDIFDREQPTVIQSGLADDVDYIIIPI